MGKSVRVIGIEPQALHEAPAAIGSLLAEAIGPDEFGVVLIAPSEDRESFALTNLWQFAPELPLASEMET